MPKGFDTFQRAPLQGVGTRVAHDRPDGRNPSTFLRRQLPIWGFTIQLSACQWHQAYRVPGLELHRVTALSAH